MQKIYKYELEITDFQVVSMLDGAEILSVGLDPHDNLCLWAMVNPNEVRYVEKQIVIIGTGNPILDNPGKFIGTVRRSSFMWHVFERV